MNIIYTIYHKISGVWIVKWLTKVYRNGFFISNFIADRKLRKVVELQKKDKKDTIKVVFLCQYVAAWSKVEPVYKKMIEDTKFEVYIISIYDNICGFKEEETYKYILGLGYKNIIRVRDEKEVYDIRSLNPQYVFYQRPYDRYLPKQYQSKEVSKYAKIFHIPYGYLLTKTSKDICMTKLFFRNVYLYLAENELCAEYNIERFKYSHHKGYRKTVNLGYPAIEDFMNKKEESASDSKEMKVLWTPRWSDSREAGGSNFLCFKDKIVSLVKNNNDFSLVFRPHPLTFSHFISENKITEKERDEYIGIYAKNKNMYYDTSEDYSKIFWNVDVLLTDPSSIIVDFFLTGKPIIYCDTGMIPDRVFEKMIEVMYVVKNWDEAEKVIMKLKNGEDNLLEIRKRRIKELFGEDFNHISSNIVNYIKKDYFEK